MAFVDLEKTFDRVPRKVDIWGAMRKLGVEEWVIRLVLVRDVHKRSKQGSCQ